MRFICALILLYVAVFDVMKSEQKVCKALGTKCPSGFRQYNRNCIDIDECEDDPCHEPLTRCVNSPGGYECLCYEGYEYSEPNDICIPKECEDGWEQFGINCYQLSNQKNLFDDAEADCVSKGGHIMSISNLEEKHYYETTMANNQAQFSYFIVWTGLARHANKTQYSAFYTEKLKNYFQWSNGDYYTGFPAIEDVKLKYGETYPYCGTIWRDFFLEDCRGTNKYRCQRDKDADGSCGDWFEVNGYCYHTNTNPDDDEIWVPYGNASETCALKGGRLPVFSEDDDVTGLVEQGVAGWLGFEGTGRPFDQVIAQMGELFRWTDGTPYEPGIIYLREFDMDERNINIGYFMHRNTEHYYNPSLTTNSLYYICEKPL